MQYDNFIQLEWIDGSECTISESTLSIQFPETKDGIEVRLYTYASNIQKCPSQTLNVIKIPYNQPNHLRFLPTSLDEGLELLIELE
jgi:hypothetical protein